MPDADGSPPVPPDRGDFYDLLSLLPDAQRALLDTQLLIAQEHLRREQYAKARAAWEAFVAQNPLDARVPQVLFQLGESDGAKSRGVSEVDTSPDVLQFVTLA